MSGESPMLEVYEEYYRRAEASPAFSRYCEMTFGVDLSQDGFSDAAQLELMLDRLEIGSDDRCLDIGCGNGRIAAYVSDRRGAVVDGIDYSNAAVASARSRGAERGASQVSRFEVADINRLSIPTELYSVIYLIDSLYFSEDYDSTLSTLYAALAPGGRLGLFYSDFLFDLEARRRIEAGETPPASVFASKAWAYEAVDLTREHYELMLRKRRSAEACRIGLEAEGNDWLYERARRESIGPETGYEAFRNFSNRYLYTLRKPRP